MAAADSSRLDRWDQERTEATERLLWLMHEDDAAGDETA